MASDGGGSIERDDPYGHFACTRKFSHHDHGLNHSSAAQNLPDFLNGKVLNGKMMLSLTLKSILGLY